MLKFVKFAEYMYLVACVLFLYKAYEEYAGQGERMPLYLGIAAVALFMFFLRRWFRKRVEKRYQDQ